MDKEQKGRNQNKNRPDNDKKSHKRTKFIDGQAKE